MIKSKVLFLDIDGVLNTVNTPVSLNSGLPGLDQDKIDLIKSIIERVPELKIVVSSIWRLHAPAIEELKKHFDVFDVTPFFDNRPRSWEIWAWINAHHAFQHSRVQFVSLDDDDFDMVGVGLIKTSWEQGLTPEIADKVVQELTKE